MAPPTFDVDDLLNLQGWSRTPILDQAELHLPPGVEYHPPSRIEALFGLHGFQEPYAVLLAMPRHDALPAPFNDRWMMTAAFHPVGPVTRNDVKPKERAGLLDALVRKSAIDNERRAAAGLPPYVIARHPKEPIPSVTGGDGSPLAAHWKVVVTLDDGREPRHCENWLRAASTSDGVLVLRILAHPVVMLDLEPMVRKIFHSLKLDPAKAPPPRRPGKAGSSPKGSDVILEMVPLVFAVV